MPPRPTWCSAALRLPHRLRRPSEGRYRCVASRASMPSSHGRLFAWAQLTAMLDDKAASAGVELVKVDPRDTSQTCPECGPECGPEWGIVAAKTLAEREHRCESGCV